MELMDCYWFQLQNQTLGVDQTEFLCVSCIEPASYLIVIDLFIGYSK